MLKSRDDINVRQNKLLDSENQWKRKSKLMNITWYIAY